MNGLVLKTNQREIWKDRVKEKWERLKYTNYWNVTRWYTEHASFKDTLIWWFERISCGAFSRLYPIYVFHSLFFFLYINFFFRGFDIFHFRTVFYFELRISIIASQKLHRKFCRNVCLIYARTMDKWEKWQCSRQFVEEWQMVSDGARACQL